MKDRATGRGGLANPPIRALFLDLGNVLLHFDLRRFFQKLLPFSPLSLEEIARRFAESPLAPLYESGKISSQEFRSDIRRLFEAEGGEDEFFEAWSSIFDPVPSVDAVFLERLARNYTLVLVSNTNEAHFEFLERRFRLMQAFHYLALSYRIGAKKPDPRIYLAALGMARIPAGEVFYADDLEANVEAARAIGLRAAQVRSKAELESQMAANGVRLPDDDPAGN